MGFPEWTLWGMGVSVAGALITITLSWLGQSPQMLRRLGLSGARLDLRVRTFTGFALALLLMAVAFFLAGVPLGTSSEGSVLAEQPVTPPVDPNLSAATTDESATEASASLPDERIATPSTPETGAFSGPPASDLPSRAIDPASELPPTESSLSPDATRPPTSEPNDVDVQSTPEPSPILTETATPVPTETPLPTLTPTAIAGETALLSTNGSTLWLKRSPGGQNLVLVRDGELVLTRAGRANQGGLLWREVATLDGVEGWLQEEFLLPTTEPASNS